MSSFLLYTCLVTIALLALAMYHYPEQKEPLTVVDRVQQRLHNWCQTAEARLSVDSMAPAFIEPVGAATLYPASPEIPHLFSASLGDPNAKTDSAWDTPSGEV